VTEDGQEEVEIIYVGTERVLANTEEILDFTCSVELEHSGVTNHFLNTTNKSLKTPFFPDSGASHSIISKYAFDRDKKFWQKTKFYWKSVRAVSADGSIITYYGTVKARVKGIKLCDRIQMHVSELDREIELHILDIQKEAILGLSDLGRIYILYYMQLAYNEKTNRHVPEVLLDTLTRQIEMNQMSLTQDSYDKIKGFTTI